MSELMKLSFDDYLAMENGSLEFTVGDCEIALKRLEKSQKKLNKIVLLKKGRYLMIIDLTEYNANKNLKEFFTAYEVLKDAVKGLSDEEIKEIEYKQNFCSRKLTQDNIDFLIKIRDEQNE